MTRTVTIKIPGTPQQQGSKNVTHTGHMYEANKNLKLWRSVAIMHCYRQFKYVKITGPCRVAATFMYERPASHYGTGRNSGHVKDSAPFYKSSAPDLDKLQRALGDVLTQSGVIADDRLIVEWISSKKWASEALTILNIQEAE